MSEDYNNPFSKTTQAAIVRGGKQTIYGIPPSKSNQYIIITFKKKGTDKNHASLAKSSKLKQYEKDFYIQCNQYRDAKIDEYFELEADVFYPNQRSDLDNAAKCLLDCLQGVGAIVNDNKLTKLTMRKFLDKLNPRIEFTIKTAM